ncbi:LuxR C-terminal-related transcriptional regulator [Aquihabitans sp. McL0605]|uniref:LuxR C-terminal-related transcriptional regulator n=1 Tax=Aquihabitans sp. McL0605 TaxID=3415671 RepID=UPI003CF8D789
MVPLLETKLHLPRRSATGISRPRLDEQLSGTASAALAVVSAPAGFGKTTAVVDWLDSLPPGEPHRAWLSLDDRDDDPATFWTYVVAALRRALGEELVDASWALLQAQAPIEAVVATLVNELVAVTPGVVLVLDDYQVIGSPEIHQSVALLLDQLPVGSRLVIATRADPPLPLGRLRAGGRLVELRAADLRFTASETATYLAGATDAAISSDDVDALAQRTEGWAAALQLAALSVRGREDISSFVADFAGDDRYVVDYLAEEVLDRQPDDVRRFLLQTSILERLSGRLGEAVTGQPGGQAMLERLERANLFLVPLDDRRRWYRYHHLFADVLRVHLAEEQHQAVEGLHLRASAWFEADGDLPQALHHAVAAGDLSRAADLTEAAIPAWRRDRQEATMRSWLELLPDDEIRSRPVLIVAAVSAGAAVGVFHADAEERLDEAERLLERGGAEPRRDESPLLRSLPATIEVYRAAIALTHGDLDGTQQHGRLALERAAPDDLIVRPSASALLGLSSWAAGDIGTALSRYTEAVVGLRDAGHLSDALGCSITVADLLLAQGRLQDALRTCTDGLELGTSGLTPLRGTADMHVGASEVHLARGDLDAARHHLDRSAELGEHNGLPQHPYRSRLAMARLRAAEGDVDAAVALLDEATAVYTTDFSPSVRPIPAVRAALQADHGDLEQALRWQRERGLTADDDLDYLHEFEHITTARVLVAHARSAPADGDAHGAARLLERLLADAEQGGRAGTALQIRVLLAGAAQARGDRDAALAHLDLAVEQAAPEGYVQVFLDEGPWIRPLLETLLDRGRSAAHLRRVLGLRTEPVAGRRAQPLIDPLSDRELEVLRLLAGDLTGPAIARELNVSLNTLRTHTRNIYAKVGATSRREAVSRAAALDLLTHRPRP